MALDFIFMLTRNDRTIEDAAERLRTVQAAGIRHIGFKDVGLPIDDLTSLARSIRDGGGTCYLEVVSLDRNSELASARAALEIGVDVLLGGTQVEDVLPIIEGSGVRYMPFPGRIVGHPSVLEGTLDEIVASAVSHCGRDGVHGLDLLAYRWGGDVPALMKAVCNAVDKPVVVAGSIDCKERIAAVHEAGASAYTIGTAALDGAYPADGTDLSSQLRAILRDTANVDGRLSPHAKKSLSASFAKFDDTWSPRVAGRINDMQIKVAKFAGEFVWHHHEAEDELFLVHRGRLLMKFRDREETVEEGEFIVVPHGVEHCPVALSDVCEVVLLEPGTTVNTGDAVDERRVTELEAV